MYDYIVVSEIANEKNPYIATTPFLYGSRLLLYKMVFLDITSIFYSMSKRKDINEYTYPTTDKEIKEEIYNRIRELRIIGNSGKPIVIYGLKENVFFSRKEYKQLMIKHLFEKDIEIINAEEKNQKETRISVEDYLSEDYLIKCKVNFKEKALEVNMPYDTKANYIYWRNTKLIFWEDMDINKLADKEYVRFIYNKIQSLK